MYITQADFDRAAERVELARTLMGVGIEDQLKMIGLDPIKIAALAESILESQETDEDVHALCAGTFSLGVLIGAGLSPDGAVPGPSGGGG